MMTASPAPLSMQPGNRQGDAIDDVDDGDDDCHRGFVHDNDEDDHDNSGCWLWRPREQPALGRALALARG